MWANDPDMAEEWEKHTPKDKKLPEKAPGRKNKAFRAVYLKLISAKAR